MKDASGDLNAWFSNLSPELRAALARHAIDDPDLLIDTLPPPLDEEFGRSYLKVFSADEIFDELFDRMVDESFAQERDD
jgi:hypothetical protein